MGVPESRRELLPSLRIRRPDAYDRAGIDELLVAAGTFDEGELAVARELADSAIARPGVDYDALICDAGMGLPPVSGYVCFGRTPMTRSTWDLYWIATHPRARGRGVASRLFAAVEDEARRACASGDCVTIRVETSIGEIYGAARSLYERLGYAEVGRIRDFYRPGDDLITLAKRLER